MSKPVRLTQEERLHLSDEILTAIAVAAGRVFDKALSTESITLEDLFDARFHAMVRVLATDIAAAERLSKPVDVESVINSLREFLEEARKAISKIAQEERRRASSSIPSINHRVSG